MAFSTIDKSTLYQNTVLYTGTGATASITGVGFQPDLSWIKVRDNTDNHVLFDAVRGATKRLEPNVNDAEVTAATELTAFDSDGFSTGSADRVNRNTDTYASWNWKAGTTSGIAAGSQTITPTAYSINTTSGIGIYAYEGAGGVDEQTISHGLGQEPSLLLVKRVNSDKDWTIYHSSLGATKYLELNNTIVSATDSTMWDDTEPTSSLITIGTNSQVNANPGDTYIMYAFAEISGYSKFGSYIGNANADGPFIFTGFKPSFVIIKGAISGDGDAAQSWELYDNKREGYNVDNDNLKPNTNAVESTGDRVNLLSNGFKIIVNSDGVNDNASTYIYMAFGQPIVSNSGTPATAR
jgi:hypothetical protein